MTSDIDKIEQELHSIIEFGDSNSNNNNTAQAQLLLKFVNKHSDHLHSKHYLNLVGRSQLSDVNSQHC